MMNLNSEIKIPIGGQLKLLILALVIGVIWGFLAFWLVLECWESGPPWCSNAGIIAVPPFAIFVIVYSIINFLFPNLLPSNLSLNLNNKYFPSIGEFPGFYWLISFIFFSIVLSYLFLNLVTFIAKFARRFFGSTK